MSRLQFTTGAGHRRERTRQPARRVPCVLGARHVAVSKGVGARRSTKDSRKGSLPDPRNAAQRGSANSAPHEARLSGNQRGGFRVEAGGSAPVSKEYGKSQPLRALCFSRSRYRRNRLHHLKGGSPRGTRSRHDLALNFFFLLFGCVHHHPQSAA